MDLRRKLADAAIGVAALFGTLAFICLLPAAVGSECPAGCVRLYAFLKDWQTLIAAAAAFLGGWLAFRAASEQARSARDQVQALHRQIEQTDQQYRARMGARNRAILLRLWDYQAGCDATIHQILETVLQVHPTAPAAKYIPIEGHEVVGLPHSVVTELGSELDIDVFISVTSLARQMRIIQVAVEESKTGAMTTGQLYNIVQNAAKYADDTRRQLEIRIRPHERR